MITGIKIESALNECNQKRVSVGKSFAGLGLFATDAFKRGDKIVEYTGYKLVGKEQVDAVPQNRYLLEVSDRVTINGAPRFNIARYANHSCKPNAEMRTVGTRAILYALRAIRPGDEILWNYGKEYAEKYFKPCLCAAHPKEESHA